ncbi:hypothetical protein RJT34_30532 [Clitoria ternatea]|uniref:Uncharacterized protein n=1 Tax=Clitoria ternatea TaxID=43366 RepID=A0AAN9EX57_CLITE
METTSICRNSSSLISILTKNSLPSRHTLIFVPLRHGSHRFNPISCTSESSSNNSSVSNTNNDDGDSNSVQAPTTTPQPSPVEISFRRRSRRQARRQREDEAVSSSMRAKVMESPPKKWEDMTLGEKAVELYMGEKGALFWLNKFAYASIFIMIGGWILFRFVGPALNIYQLDTPVLAPTDVFK